MKIVSKWKDLGFIVKVFILCFLFYLVTNRFKQ